MYFLRERFNIQSRDTLRHSVEVSCINAAALVIQETDSELIDRPLPYLIGSKLFMEQEDVGLGELSSEGTLLHQFFYF